MYKKRITVEILNGLPGSGKTYYGQRKASQDKNISYISVEQESHIWRKKMWDVMNGDSCILDGLFLTTENIICFLEKECKKENLIDTVSRIVITHFLEDRETCLKNDAGRRQQNSENTIRSAPFEYPDIERLKGMFPKIQFEIQERKIELKPDWMEKASQETLSHIFGGYLYSDKWIVEGRYRYYSEEGGESYESIAPEPALPFNELFQWLIECYPYLSFMQWAYIQNNLTWDETSDEGDYYCDMTKAYHVADLNAIAKYMEGEKEDLMKMARFSISCSMPVPKGMDDDAVVTEITKKMQQIGAEDICISKN